MATVTNTSSSNPVNWYNPNSSTTTGSTTATGSQSSTSNSADPTSSLANESTFLTLLVAQLKNQDPTQPADGTQFVTQLAQFSTLEQNLAMRTDLDSINTDVASMSSKANSSSSNTGTGSTSAA